MESSAYSLPEVLSRQRSWFQQGNTRAIQGRLAALSRLKAAIKAYEPRLIQALYEDLGKSELEAFMTEIGIVLDELSRTLRHLPAWARPKRVKTVLTHLGSKGRILSEPYGTVLIMAPWNYPFQLAISPLIGAIAAGNTVVLKPSELSPAVSGVLEELLAEVFPPEYVRVVQGGVDVSTALLEQKFDYIFFTGSVPVGRVVMKAAARHLTPVTLELGGKSPCIVHKDADIKLAARRIMFGKLTNAGQTCIAPDYLWVHSEVKQELLKAFRSVITEFYGDKPLMSPSYGKMISRRHFDRQTGFLQDAVAVIGGEFDPKTLKIAPTVLDQVTWDMPVMQEEIFGPLLPLLEYTDLEEVIRVTSAHPKPLALYLFTRDRKVEEQVLSRISFGGGTVNDTLMHLATPYLPFGGVGESGMGSYHGRQSFRTFSHEKSVLKQTNLFDLSLRYPSSKRGLRWIRKLLK
ncbi:aldehyde dehydrogenase [Paenibacillus sp. CAA11]|uniref:aldehyde dehydrogenase n=1 Tax=Paenibacillus sp. CAA11 TaxID=1532905 RepID=UPI001F1BDF46|nr:aldehyde dehydrogenase [Paenibacillus sp. CAA11]